MHLEKTTHIAFFHPAWKELRTKWSLAVNEAKTPEDLAAALTKLESCLRPIVFVGAWHEGIGMIETF